MIDCTDWHRPTVRSRCCVYIGTGNHEKVSYPPDKVSFSERPLSSILFCASRFFVLYFWFENKWWNQLLSYRVICKTLAASSAELHIILWGYSKIYSEYCTINTNVCFTRSSMVKENSESAATPDQPTSNPFLALCSYALFPTTLWPLRVTVCTIATHRARPMRIYQENGAR